MHPTASSPAATSPERAQPGAARTGLIVFSALLTQIVIIGAACNQWVAVRIGDQIAASFVNGGSQTVRDFKQMLLVFNWRYAPRSTDHQHIWLGQVLMILTLLVVSGLLISVLTSGPIGFARAFFGTWTAVVFGTLVSAYVRGLVNEASTSSSPRITRALFEGLGPNTVTVLTGIALGLVTAVVAAIVAVQTRRSPASAAAAPGSAEEPYVAPEQPPAFFGTSPIPPWQDVHYGPPGRHGAAPAQPAAESVSTAEPTSSDAAPTTRLPDSGSTQTTRFPRPPDDDDLGHVP